MYKVLVEVAPSRIQGSGVFAREPIEKGSIVWTFTDHHDRVLSQNDYIALDEAVKKKLDTTGYLSPWTGLWVFPPEGDPAQYTNHSNQNNLSAVYDASVSPEPYFIANRDIEAGEELTNNYHEFDRVTRETKPEWAA